MTDFGIRLKESMERKNMSAAELSRASGIGKNLISYYLKGKCLAGQDKVYKLAKALDVNPGWLITGVEQKETVRKEIIIPDSELFAKLIRGMSPLDYEVMMDILERTNIAMQKRGEL